jgi:hypothetical protein
VEHLDDSDLETLSAHWKLDPAMHRLPGDDSDDDEQPRNTWTRRWALRALRRALHEWLSNQWVLAEVAAAPAPPRAWATVAGILILHPAHGAWSTAPSSLRLCTLRVTSSFVWSLMHPSRPCA